MPKTEGGTAAAQRTTSGTGDSLPVAGSPRSQLYVRHVNGTGTITAQGSAVVEVQTHLGNWYDLTTIGFGTTASAAVERVVDLPESCVAARLVYTAPTGSTGHTLDYEVGTTALT